MKNILTAFSTTAGFAAVLIASATTLSSAAINISVDAQKGIKKISPYLYGRNIDKISVRSNQHFR